MNNAFGGAFEDSEYDVATANATYAGENHYHYAQVSPSLSGRQGISLPMYEVPSNTDATPEPPPRQSEEFRIVKIEQADLWPLWSAVVLTLIIAIAALAQATTPQPVVMQAQSGASEVTGSITRTATTQQATTTSSTSTTTTQSTTVERTAPATGCYCTRGTVTFAVSNPGPCYALANGQNGRINLLQNNGLYIRAGTPDRSGTVLEQMTAVNGLTVATTATMSSEMPPVYGPDGTGQPDGWYFEQSTFQSYTRDKGGQCSNSISTSTHTSGDAETRPPSMYLAPYVCL